MNAPERIWAIRDGKNVYAQLAKTDCANEYIRANLVAAMIAAALNEAADILLPAANSKSGLWALRKADLRDRILALIPTKPAPAESGVDMGPTP